MNSYACKLASATLIFLWPSISNAAETSSQLISDEQIYRATSIQFEETKKTVPSALDKAFAQRAKCIAEALIAVAPDVPKGVKWDIQVFEDRVPNVFSMPGGQLGINSGIRSVAQNTDELAFAIAVPITQVILKHIQKSFTRKGAFEIQNAVMKQFGIPPVNAAFEQIEAAQKQKDQIEADSFGRKLMSAASFDTRASITLLEKLAANQPLIKNQIEPRLRAAREETQSNSPSASDADFKVKKHQCEN